MKAFQDKHCLFIAPFFWGYEHRIAKELANLGLKVYIEYQVPRGIKYKVLNKISHKLVSNLELNYYNRLLAKYSEYNLDYLFVLTGFGLPISFIDKLKEINPNIYTVMYQWDSMKFYPYSYIKDKFDAISTFDIDDSSTLSIRYIPLFYSKEFDDVYVGRQNCDIDYLFIGSYSDERLAFCNRLSDALSNTSSSFVNYLYIPRRVYFLLNVRGIHVNKADVKFQSLSFDNYLSLLNRCKIVVDFTHSRQSGFPIRLIEAIGAGKKVVTNNHRVLDYLPQGQDQVVFFENVDDIVNISPTFSKPINREDFSLKKWVEQVFNISSSM